jgi:hypothetical protein
VTGRGAELKKQLEANTTVIMGIFTEDANKLITILQVLETICSAYLWQLF